MKTTEKDLTLTITVVLREPDANTLEVAGATRGQDLNTFVGEFIVDGLQDFLDRVRKGIPPEMKKSIEAGAFSRRRFS